MMMNDKPDSNLDQALERELQSLLRPDPPSSFETRLRARIAREEKRAWVRPWMFASAGAIAAAAVVMVLVFGSHETVPSSQESKADTAVVAPPAPPIPNTPKSEAKSEPKPVSVTHSRRSTRIESREPELLIAASEVNALRRLMSGPPLRLPADFSGSVETNELRTPAIVINPIDAPAPIRIEPIELPAAAEPAGGQ